MTNGRGRTYHRQSFDQVVRITLLEDDIDRVDTALLKMEDNLRKLTLAVVAAALSLTTASILLALNLATGG